MRLGRSFCVEADLNRSYSGYIYKYFHVIKGIALHSFEFQLSVIQQCNALTVYTDLFIAVGSIYILFL